MPAVLDISPRFADPDAAYRLLVEAHRGRDAAASAALNARLVLILANQIGDERVLAGAIDLALAAEAENEAGEGR